MNAHVDDTARTGRRVALVGIVASALLATLNIVVGLVTRSTSVFATSVEFAGDVLASTVVLLGMIVGLSRLTRIIPTAMGESKHWRRFWWVSS